MPKNQLLIALLGVAVFVLGIAIGSFLVLNGPARMSGVQLSVTNIPGHPELSPAPTPQVPVANIPVHAEPSLAPTLSIGSLRDGEVVSGTVKVVVSISDGLGIKNVSFYKDQDQLASLNNAPYVLSWDTTRELNGLHTLRVVASNATSSPTEIKISRTIHVTVVGGQNPPPQPNPGPILLQ